MSTQVQNNPAHPAPYSCGEFFRSNSLIGVVAGGVLIAVGLLLKHYVGVGSMYAYGLSIFGGACATLSFAYHLVQLCSKNVNASSKGITTLHSNLISESSETLVSTTSPRRPITTPLHEATKNENFRIVSHIYEDVNTADSEGNTPLHLARHKLMITALIKEGAQVDYLNDGGLTPIDCQFIDCHTTWKMNERLEIVEYMLDQKSDLASPQLTSIAKRLLDYCKECERDNQTYSHITAKDPVKIEFTERTLRIFDRLIELGLYLDESMIDRSIPASILEGLKVRIATLQSQMCEHARASEDVNAVNVHGFTSLHLAKSYDEVSSLLNQGAMLDIPDRKRQTAFEQHSKSKDPKIFSIVLENASSHVLKQNFSDEKRPLWYFIESDFSRALALLYTDIPFVFGDLFAFFKDYKHDDDHLRFFEMVLTKIRLGECKLDIQKDILPQIEELSNSEVKEVLKRMVQNRNGRIDLPSYNQLPDKDLVSEALYRKYQQRVLSLLSV